jgi:hypothetical protein
LKFFTKETPLLDSGLIGPVKLETGLRLPLTSQISWSAENDQPKAPAKNQAEKKISPFKLTNKTGSYKMEVKAGGSVSLNGNVIGTLKGDGVMLSKDGKKMACLKPDGKVLMNGKPIGKILGNGDVDLAVVGVKASWKDDKIQLREEFTLDSKDRKSKRWASFVLLLFM